MCHYIGKRCLLGDSSQISQCASQTSQEGLSHINHFSFRLPPPYCSFRDTTFVLEPFSLIYCFQLEKSQAVILCKLSSVLLLAMGKFITCCFFKCQACEWVKRNEMGKYTTQQGTFWKLHCSKSQRNSRLASSRLQSRSKSVGDIYARHGTATRF